MYRLLDRQAVQLQWPYLLFVVNFGYSHWHACSHIYPFLWPAVETEKGGLPKNKCLTMHVQKGYGLKCPRWWECSLAAISQTTAHMHGHHEATMGLAGVSLGRELRALALSHNASVRAAWYRLH